MRASNGFTLIELLVTVTVLVIIVSMATPGFMQQIRKNRVVTTVSELQGALAFARTEAVKRSALVSICPSENGSSCLTTGDWAKGWMVFLDQASSEYSSMTSVGTVLRVWRDLNDEMDISVKKGASQSLSFLRFNNLGLLARANDTDTDSRVFSIKVASCSSDIARTVTVGYAGMVNTAQASCSTL